MHWQLVVRQYIVTPILLSIVCFIVFQCLFLCWNRWLRSRNIKNAGWPPSHCDADGDFKPQPKENDS